jgi:chemotaxis protein MotB
MSEERRINPYKLPLSERKGDRKSGAWMITFTDLLSLMLAFFVLLFSMKQVELESWRSFVEGMSDQLNPANEWTDPGKVADKTIGRVNIRRASDLGYLQAVFEDKMRKHDELAGMYIHRLDDRLVISLPENMLFPSGSATISETGKAATEVLSAVFGLLLNRVDIVGYSDPEPITDQTRFQSNWDLSLSRAMAVANAFIASGYGQKLRIVGRGDGQYYDLSDDLSFELRMALARRVDIIVRENLSDEVDG